MNGESCIVLAILLTRDQSAHTSSSVESAATSFTFEMLSFLMGNENLQVIEITLTCEEGQPNSIRRGLGMESPRTVITPGASEEFLDVGMTALLLSYHGGCGAGYPVCR